MTISKANTSHSPQISQMQEGFNRLPTDLKIKILDLAFNASIIRVSRSFLSLTKKTDAYLGYKFDQLEKLIKIKFIKHEDLSEAYLTLAQLAAGYSAKAPVIVERYWHIINRMSLEQKSSLLQYHLISAAIIDVYLIINLKKEAHAIFLHLKQVAQNKTNLSQPNDAFQRLLYLSMKLNDVEAAESLVSGIEKRYCSNAFFKLIKAASYYGHIDFSIQILKKQIHEVHFDFLGSLCVIAHAINKQNHPKKRGVQRKRQEALQELLPFFTKTKNIHERLEEFSSLARIFSENGLKKEILEILHQSLLNVDLKDETRKTSPIFLLNQYVSLFIQLDSIASAQQLLEKFPKPLQFSERGSFLINHHERYHLLPPKTLEGEDTFLKSTVSTPSSELASFQSTSVEEMEESSPATALKIDDVYEKVNLAESEYAYETAYMTIVNGLINQGIDPLPFAHDSNDRSIQIQTLLLLSEKQVVLQNCEKAQRLIKEADQLLGESFETYEECRLANIFSHRVCTMSLDFAEHSFKSALEVLSILAERKDKNHYKTYTLSQLTLETAKKKKWEVMKIFLEISEKTIEPERHLKLLRVLLNFLLDSGSLAEAKTFKEHYFKHKKTEDSHAIKWENLFKIKFSILENNGEDRESCLESLKQIIIKGGDDKISIKNALDAIHGFLGDRTIQYLNKLMEDIRSYEESRKMSLALNSPKFNDTLLEIAQWLSNRKRFHEAFTFLNDTDQLTTNHLKIFKSLLSDWLNFLLKEKRP